MRSQRRRKFAAERNVDLARKKYGGSGVAWKKGFGTHTFCPPPPHNFKGTIKDTSSRKQTMPLNPFERSATHYLIDIAALNSLVKTDRGMGPKKWEPSTAKGRLILVNTGRGSLVATRIHENSFQATRGSRNKHHYREASFVREKETCTHRKPSSCARCASRVGVWLTLWPDAFGHCNRPGAWLASQMDPDQLGPPWPDVTQDQ